MATLSPNATLFAGTSGWAYPSWKPCFYPPKTPATKFLTYYASQLTSVEVNYTFRALPTIKMLESWLDATPADFRFSFKAPQRITHFNRLQHCEDLLKQFVGSLVPVQERHQLGLLLFQLPPNFQATEEHRERLGMFLADSSLKSARIAVEFRHDSWFTEDTYTLLGNHGAALCIADSSEIVSPEIFPSKTHAFFRFRREGGYPSAELKAMAQRLARLAEHRDVFAYFRHEEEPTGALNAMDFLKAARKG